MKLRVCLNCPNLTTATRCPACQEKHAPGRTPTDKRYGTKRWRDYSAARLACFPYCALCGLLADLTDHILSVRTHPHLFWAEYNHRSLCRRCNALEAEKQAGNEPVVGVEPPRRFTIA